MKCPTSDQRALGFSPITAPCHLVTVSYLLSQTELRFGLLIYKMEHHSSVQWLCRRFEELITPGAWHREGLQQWIPGPVLSFLSPFLHPPPGGLLRPEAAGNIQRDAGWNSSSVSLDTRGKTNHLQIKDLVFFLWPQSSTVLKLCAQRPITSSLSNLFA